MTIGEKFKNARKKKGISLINVSEKTRIHSRILEAIEEERFSELPNPVYVKGFLRKYAQFLGLSPEEIINEYLNLFPEKPEQELILPGLPLPQPDWWPKKLAFPAFLIIIVILSAIVINFLRLPPASAPPPPPPALKKTSPEFRLPLTLKAETREDCWIRVRSDGKIIFERVMNKGKTATFEAKEKLELRVGRAEALRLELNGTSLGAPGKGTIDILITKAGIKVID